ncbi:peptide deformylase [Butyricicoccus porcorum]|uniref:Peptide deformylase n=1 Tax=Butyricicoccus porcorum TaxID=1945634 RepID=A0A252F6K6_9FIRM|nr:peptide deformylase [Butyricicoccus porcorum]MCI6925514.1 peptide deformylase [Butyricicoccus porcorum]MDD6986332.1 peptide deformylase [Butyricicoccus porcorum]MDY4483635.1 peptide deformylase [Butyricicoccus porcorum]OUM21407.1 peptide deformylase [Butyricicoccus porcorum]
MPVRQILTDPDPVLYKKCHPVTKFDKRLASLLEDMAQTMLAANGVGLAGPQIGMVRRVCVVLDTNNNDRIIELVNPEVIATEGSQTGSEGCLSFPDKFGIVTRPNVVTVRAQDRNGEWFTITGQGLTARAFLHEIDHLDGHVFTEKVSKFIEPAGEEDEEE